MFRVLSEHFCNPKFFNLCYIVSNASFIAYLNGKQMVLFLMLLVLSISKISSSPHLISQT
jgi:hypothetical protein